MSKNVASKLQLILEKLEIMNRKMEGVIEKVEFREGYTTCRRSVRNHCPKGESVIDRRCNERNGQWLKFYQH